MEGKESSCGGLPSQVVSPLQSDGGEDQEDKSEKNGVYWDKGSLISEPKLYKQESKIRNSVSTFHQQAGVGPSLGKLINVTWEDKHRKLEHLSFLTLSLSFHS